MQTRLGRAGTLIGAVVFVVSGAWALVAPGSFYDQIATWPPYNDHFIHDIGVFQLGIGVALAATLFRNAVPVAALTGAAAAAIVHVISHVIDLGEGGGSSDPYVLGVLALVLLAALVAELTAERQGTRSPSQ